MQSACLKVVSSLISSPLTIANGRFRPEVKRHKRKELALNQDSGAR